MKWLKKHLVTLILTGILFLGIGLILYPSVSDYWNSLHQSYAISDYSQTVANINDKEYQEIMNKAIEYNDKLADLGMRLSLSADEQKEYTETLNIGGTGMMGYIEIPKIKCSLPIYHGIDDGVLQAAIGHIPGSSLPVGGNTSHCILSGHRGLPSAKLFTDLDKMEKGDTFVLRVLDEVLTYQVDQILIVEPSDVSSLVMDEGQDYCTLVTCTPYGINTHRLLVRGHRIENEKNSVKIRVVAEAIQIDRRIVAPIIAIPILLLMILGVLISGRRKR